MAAFVQDLHIKARHRHRRRADLDRQSLNPDGVRGNGIAGFGLPPMVDHRHVQMALGPQNGVRVGTLPGKVQGLQPRQVVIAHQLALGILALHRANGGRRGEEGAHLMFRNHPPEGARIRRAHGLAFKDNRGAARDQRRIANVGMPHDPAHVRGRPEHIARSAIVDRAHRPVQRHQMACRRAYHALRRAGGA